MKLPPTWKLTRTGVLFVGGMAGIAHEALTRGIERPTLLLLFGAMVGLPTFLGKDEKAEKKEP